MKPVVLLDANIFPAVWLLDIMLTLDEEHVLAAALAAGADYIVTYNLKDFLPRSLERYAVEAVHPDEFLSMMLNRDQAGVVNAMNAVVSSKDNPPRTMTEELAHLRKLRLSGFADGMERIAR